ncbi:hypothetical protein B0H13DRAFT_2658001 [Mycena leptocephala]|nr:hypothetical protein B0H13DRAFT_2658001 [Mycena leptocephala]
MLPARAQEERIDGRWRRHPDVCNTGLDSPALLWVPLGRCGLAVTTRSVQERRAGRFERRLGLLAQWVAVRFAGCFVAVGRTVSSSSCGSSLKQPRFRGTPEDRVHPKGWRYSSTRGPGSSSPWFLLSSVTVRIARDLQRLATLPAGSTPSTAYMDNTRKSARAD